MIVHRSLYRDFVDSVADLYASVRLGPTDDPATDVGPLISMKHREKVAGMVDRARSTARVLGGGIPGGALAFRSDYRPTLVPDTGARHWGPTRIRPARSSATRYSRRCWR